VSSKITIIEQLMKRVNNLIIGGGMSYTFVKAQGGKIGNSICEDDQLQLASAILAKAKMLNVNVYLSSEELITDAKFENFSNPSAVLNTKVCAIDAIPDGWGGVDVAPASIETWRKIIMESKTILWNGPVGVFEVPKFANGTKAVAQMVADATAEGAYSLVGGGDSVAAVNQMGFADKVSYVSTGGGALLEYMEGIELPGVKAIRG
jgi:phosphoglycerate kinase